MGGYVERITLMRIERNSLQTYKTEIRVDIVLETNGK